MLFDLDHRTASLSVGDFANFTVGPHDAGGGSGGVWRAQLGTHWHNELRARATAEHGPAAEFEVTIEGRLVHRGWTLTLSGRIDQLLRPPFPPAECNLLGYTPSPPVLREIKTVTRALPADEAELRAEYPGYFVQLATYAALWRLGSSGAQLSALNSQLTFVEPATGLLQTIALTPADEALFRVQLERVTEFLDLRLRARQRLRGLHFRPAFAAPRPGQETTQVELTAAFEKNPLVFFEAPTGFGKTGVLLEFALGQLRSGHFDRALYLTSKATGQLQVVRTLAAMTTAQGPGTATPSLTPSRPQSHAATPVAAWHVRNKAEHCVNHTFHCVRESCAYLDRLAARWSQSGLARFYLDERHARDLDTLRAAGRDAGICPYEITRAALAFNDMWIGDYNYVFAPRNRGLFFEQPGFAAARTLLLIDEAHNLPARAADAHSQALLLADALAVRDELHRTRPLATLVTAWDHWCHFLAHLRATDALSPADEDDARHLLDSLARLITTTPLDLAALGPHIAELIWQIPNTVEELAATPPLPRLWWCPRDGELALTCLDAAPAIAAILREFGGAVLASATLTPLDGFATACGLDWCRAGSTSRPEFQYPTRIGDKNPGRLGEPALPEKTPDKLGSLTKRATKKLYTQLTTAADLLRVEEAAEAARPTPLRALTPWRDGAYDVAFDARVDTTFQHRSHHYTTTAATIAALHAASGSALNSQLSALSSATPCVAVFFPSYAYAESIARELESAFPAVRGALQPRLRDLAAQSAWVDESLLLADALFLVLGSSFAESIDALGGRVTHALVVGPALPEVNAVQRARLEECRAGSPNPAAARESAFRRVYQIPGMTKVNQALGRLVRAPGQHARVILHCRRFLEPAYASLLAPDYQLGTNLHTDADLTAWLAATPP
ncbi:MAG: helicase [Verrucomicrobia bacterium]|nr:helicase [Verrucomicrobiota bacterium]